MVLVKYIPFYLILLTTQCVIMPHCIVSVSIFVERSSHQLL